MLGGGVIGVTSAYYLARAGHEVSLIERRDSCGLETSFANGGQISAGHAAPWASPEAPLELLRSLGREDAPLIFRLKADPRMWAWGLRFLRNCTARRHAANRGRMLRLGAYSRQALVELRQEVDLDYDAQARGILNIFRDERGLADAAGHAAGAQAEGGHIEVADADRCREIEPALEGSPAAITGGIYYPDDESGDAYKFTDGLAQVCAGLGVNFAYATAVNGLTANGGRIMGVDTSAGPMSADLYVMALGSYSARLAAPLGVRLPIYPVKGYSATLPLRGHNRAPLVSVIDAERMVVVGRLGDRLRVAGTAEIAGYDLTLNPVRARAVLDAALSIFPAAGDAADAEYWTGLRPMTADGPPIIGATRYANLFLNTGHGSLGWTMACGSALILADLVAGHRPAIDFDGLTLDRYRQ